MWMRRRSRRIKLIKRKKRCDGFERLWLKILDHAIDWLSTLWGGLGSRLVWAILSSLTGGVHPSLVHHLTGLESRSLGSFSKQGHLGATFLQAAYAQPIWYSLPGTCPSMDLWSLLVKPPDDWSVCGLIFFYVIKKEVFFGSVWDTVCGVWESWPGRTGECISRERGGLCEHPDGSLAKKKGGKLSH